MLLKRSEIPSLFHEPYIKSAYRRPYCGAWQCVKYAFHPHNDVINFWTHFLTLLVWVGWLVQLTRERDLTDAYYGPMVCMWVGSCSYVLFSSLAHMFSPLSKESYHICFMFDYCGIAMYMFSGGVAYYYYERPLKAGYYQWETWNIYIQMAMSISAVLFSSLSRFFWRRYRYLIRALAYSPAFFVNLIPLFLRWYECSAVDSVEKCITETVHYHLWVIIATVLLGFFFVSKLPERLSPGRFDIMAQSHQLFHILASIITSLQWKLVWIDSAVRKEILTHESWRTGVFPKLSIYYQFAFVLCVNLLIVIVLSVLLVGGIIKGDKPQQLNSEQVKKEQ